MGRLYETIQEGDRARPLFAWPSGSKRPGLGVRCCDVMGILKDAAEKCGSLRDTGKYGAHSLRGGGASAYLLAGKNLLDVALHGGWADMNSCILYVEPSLSHLMRGAQDNGAGGSRGPNDRLIRVWRLSDMQTGNFFGNCEVEGGGIHAFLCWRGYRRVSVQNPNPFNHLWSSVATMLSRAVHRGERCLSR